MTPTSPISHSGSGHGVFILSNAASARAIADDGTIEISEQSKAIAFSLGLDKLQQTSIISKSACARGYADAIAFVAAYHNPRLHRKVQPERTLHRSVFNTLERARCEALGGRKFAGSAYNITCLWNLCHSDQLKACRTQADQLLLAVNTLVRKVFETNATAQQNPPQITTISDSLIRQHPALWQNLVACIDNQRIFGHTALAIIDTIEFPDANTTDAQTRNENHNDDDDDVDDFTTEPDHNEAPPDEEDVLSVALRNEEEQSSGDLVSVETANTENADTSANRDAPISTESEGGNAGAQHTADGYRVFTTTHDEVVKAADLCSANELALLRELLDQQIHRHNRIVGKLSGKLQRVLMAQQTREWEFNLTDGILDTARLTRVVTQPLTPLSFKQEADTHFKDTSITVLVDNSKSMLGKPVAIAAACSDILSQTLERCGVSVEILGFTTTELHRGPAFERWQRQGATALPGRLNGLRHIVYKSAATPYRRSRSSFGVMLMKDLLKQNIDGESLLWAYNRLQRRPERRKILIVISDGAPIDTSTMAANPHNYLVDHLHQVIAAIESAAEVELLAIGIGHDVTRYYRRAMKIMDVKDLSTSLLAHINELFCPTSSGNRKAV